MSSEVYFNEPGLETSKGSLDGDRKNVGKLRSKCHYKIGY